MNVFQFLTACGCRRRDRQYILDGFSGDFYLRFDGDYNPEDTDSDATVDVYVHKIGSHPKDSDDCIRLRSNADELVVLNLLIALGSSRFGPKAFDAIQNAIRPSNWTDPPTEGTNPR